MKGKTGNVEDIRDRCRLALVEETETVRQRSTLSARWPVVGLDDPLYVHIEKHDNKFNSISFPSIAFVVTSCCRSVAEVRWSRQFVPLVHLASVKGTACVCFVHNQRP